MEKKVDHLKMILEYSNYGKAGKLQAAGRETADKKVIFIMVDSCSKVKPKNKRASICRKATVACALKI